MHKFFFWLMIILILLGTFWVFEMSKYTTVLVPHGIGLMVVCGFAILWYGTPNGKLKGMKARIRKSRKNANNS
jgi:hypothetical protein